MVMSSCPWEWYLWRTGNGTFSERQISYEGGIEFFLLRLEADVKAFSSFFKKNRKGGKLEAREMTKQLGALTALPEGPSSSPSNHVVAQLTTNHR